jgi:hypothetical protein
MIEDDEFDDIPELIPIYNMIDFNNNYINYINGNVINTPPLNANINPNINMIPFVLNNNIQDDEFDDMPELILIDNIMYFILMNNNFIANNNHI